MRRAMTQSSSECRKMDLMLNDNLILDTMFDGLVELVMS
jgi:hypothetical protein